MHVARLVLVGITLSFAFKDMGRWGRTWTPLKGVVLSCPPGHLRTFVRVCPVLSGLSGLVP